MKFYGFLTILFLFTSSAQAANCVPEIIDKKVVVEYLDGLGNVVRSESHRVRSKKKYKGLVSNSKAFKRLEKDKTGKIKIKGSELDFESGGLTTKVSKRDGTALARIGGCPVSKLKFYKKLGEQKSPFIHKSLIKEAAKASVKSTSAVVAVAGSETADKTKDPDNSASKTKQKAAVIAKNRAPSKSGNANKSIQKNVYGWLNGVHYSQGNSPLIDSLGIKNPGTYVAIALFGGTRILTSQTQCNSFYIDTALPKIEGISVGDLNGKPAQEIGQAFAPHRGKFIRINNVRVLKRQNQKYCLASSVEIADDLAPMDVEFTEIPGHFLSRIVDVVIRVEARDLGSSTHLKPIIPQTTSDDFDCSQYQWSTAEAAKAFHEELKQNNPLNLRKPSVVFHGVRPINKIGVCEFNTMSIVPNEKEKPIVTASAGPAPSFPAGQSRFTVSLKNDVIYLNGMTLGMPEDAAKEEMRKLNYKLENPLKGGVALYDGTNSLKAGLQKNKLTTLSTKEQGITEKSKNDMVNSMKAQFGNKFSCEEIINKKRELIRCSYTHKTQGQETSMLVNFVRWGTQKSYNLSMDLGLR